MKLKILNKWPTDWSKIKFPNIKKVAFTSILASSLLFGISGSPQADDQLTTVYYVYYNDEYIGTISDKKIVDKMVDNKLEQLKKDLKNKDLTFGNQLTYIPEQVFRSNADNESVIKKLQSDLKPLVDATAIVVGEQPIVYLEDEQSAKQVIESLKLKFVTKEQLQAVEKRKSTPNLTLPPLKENEIRILDVHFSKEVSVGAEKVAPNKIYSPAKAINFIEKGTLEEKKYKVQEGDVLGTIANDHDLRLKQLLDLNPGLKEDSLIQIDQELNIMVPEPLIKVVVEKEISVKEFVGYQKKVEENDSMYKGDTKVKQQGQNGLRTVTYSISQQNGRTVKKETIAEKMIEEPVTHIVLKGTKVIPSRGDGSFIWPTAGGYVSSQMGYRWSRMHKGIDIARPSNLTIRTVDNGVVVFAGWDGGYGKKIVVDHQNGYETIYAHLSSIDVNVGQTVPKGSSIGIMGSTGDSTGTHLHFEVYRNGALLNPLTILR